MRGAHRRRRARVGPGRELPVASRASTRGGSQAAVNSMLGPEVVVRSCELVDPASTRGTRAQWRRYRYTILNRPVPDPFRDRFAWWIPEPLDLRALRLAADPFVGEHDFASFCRKGPEGSSTTRRVLESRWVDEGDGVLRYEIRANAFCWQMVRAIVGTLVEVGAGKRRPGEMMGDPPRRATATRRGSSPRRAGCASGKSATESALAPEPADRDVRRRRSASGTVIASVDSARRAASKSLAASRRVELVVVADVVGRRRRRRDGSPSRSSMQSVAEPRSTTSPLGVDADGRTLRRRRSRRRVGDGRRPSSRRASARPLRDVVVERCRSRRCTSAADALPGDFECTPARCRCRVQSTERRRRRRSTSSTSPSS